jgi:Zn-dependent protease
MNLFMQISLDLTIFSLLVLLISVIAHEVAHGYAAYALGDPTAKLAGRLTLNPIPHIDLVGTILIPAFLILSHVGILFGWAKPVPYNPYNLKNQRWGEAIVGFAGVGTNFLIAIIFAIVARVAIADGQVVLTNLASTVTFVNLSLGLFNLIPIPPLDGFTVLRGILPYSFSMAFRDIENMLQRGGFVTLVLVLLIFCYFFSSIFYSLVESIFSILI